MIFGDENNLNVEKVTTTVLISESESNGLNNYQVILGINYTNKYNNFVPSSLKWGKKLIRTID